MTADREGGIHDFAWSPNDKEFIVTYGCESGLYHLRRMSLTRRA